MTDLLGALLRGRTAPDDVSPTGDSAADGGARSARSLLELPSRASLRTLFIDAALAREDRRRLAHRIDEEGS